MRKLLFLLAAALAAICATEAWKPSVVTLDKRHKTIDGEYGRKRGGDIPFRFDGSNKGYVEGLIDRRRKLTAGARENVAGAALDGQQAHAIGHNSNSNPEKIDIDHLEGAHVVAGRRSGDAKFGKNGNDRTADMVADDGSTLDTVAENFNRRDNSFNKATATNDRIAAKLDPSLQTKYDGRGTIGVHDKKKSRSGSSYLYTVHRNQRTKKVETELSQAVGNYDKEVSNSEFQQLLKSNQKWRCEGVASGQGESVCFDIQNNKQVGKVITTKDKVTVYDSRGARVGNAVVRKLGRNGYEVVGSDGLVSAKATNLHSKDCLREMQGGDPSRRVKISNVKFEYDAPSSGGKTTYKWPDCFKMKADITLPPQVSASRIAIEFIANVKPVGRLICQDAATCGKECFYCNYCKNRHKLQAVDDTTETNLCEQKSVRTFTAEVKVCPPEKDVNTALCSNFGKDIQYANKKGDGEFTIIVYELPQNEAALHKEVHNKLKPGFLRNINRPALKAEYLLNGGLQDGSFKMTDQQLVDWFSTKRSQQKNYSGPKMTPLACYRQTVNYAYGGSKVDASGLVDILTNTNSFFAKRCPQKDRVENEQFKAHQREYAKTGGRGGFLGGIFGSGGR